MSRSRASGKQRRRLAAPAKGRVLPAIGEAALARARTIETLEDAYQAWLELRLEHAALRARVGEQRRKLDQEGEFIVGTVRAAAASPRAALPTDLSALAESEPKLESFLRSAESKLAEARQGLEHQAAQDEARYQEAFSAIRAQITGRIERFLSSVRPKLTLMVRHLGQDLRILHLARVKADEAVLLLYVLSGRIPSRHDFLFDDSTEDAQLSPPTLYPEEGAAPDQVRPGALALLERLKEGGGALPVKGILPAVVPLDDAGERLYRLLQRGPVMEVEISEGDAFRNVLSREEAEAFAGFLLRLKLEGRIELELEPG